MNQRRVFIIVGFLVVAAGVALFLSLPGEPAPFAPATTRLTDWSKLYQGASDYYQIEPQNAEEVRAAVQKAIAAKIPIRVRGKGHSANASSLPRNDELSLSTNGLRYFRRVSEQTIIAGAGSSLYEIRQWLDAYGYDLPVYNLGGMGPSLGGYISAGGIGEGSALYGGFWENVFWIGVVDGRGAYRRIERGAPYFPWLFGSMGQLGVIVDAALRIVPVPYLEQKPLPEQGQVPTLAEQNPAMMERYRQIYESFRLYSISVFAPEGAGEPATQALHDFLRPYESQFTINRTLTLPIRFFNFNPPLMYPAQTSFTVVGIEFLPRENTNPEAALEVERQFAKFIEAKGHRHYIQMELTREPATIRAYFGAKVWDEFEQVKMEFDPLFLFGQGLFQKP
jgi:hypothetical protein